MMTTLETLDKFLDQVKIALLKTFIVGFIIGILVGILIFKFILTIL